MSGWDEGNVFFTEAFGNEEAEQRDSRATTMKKLREFIKNFARPGDSGSNFTYPYRESLQKSRKTLTVDIEDISAHDPQLARAFREAPGEHLPLLEAAAAEVLQTLKTKPAGEEGDADQPNRREVQVLITSQENPISPRQLTADHISRLVKVPGIIIASSKVKAKATQLALICKNCKTPKTVQIKAGFNGASIPRTCDHQAQVGEEACPLDPFVVVPDRSRYVDQQTLKLQEKPEDVPVGEMPRALLLSVDRHLVHLATPGKRVSVVGIFDIFGVNKEGKNKNAVAIRQPYLRVVGLTIEDAASGSEVTFTGDDEAQFKEFAAKTKVYEETAKYLVAPSIFGHEDIKKAVLCLLFGGAPKHLPDRTRLRGDINVLLLGDPSTAKSQFLKFVEKTAPICVYTSGKGSSAAGLTASVIKDSSGEFYLEGGAMVLADGGVVCIDEFDKMRPEDRVAIHEAMEQQTISIAKAGITTVLNSRTAVLAAANPPSGRYDDLKTAQENIELQTTILSRFDLIFIVKDERNHEKDMKIAEHVLRIHSTAEAAKEDDETKRQQSFLKRYVQYCRSRCSPRLSQAAAQHLQNSYVDIRQKMRERTQETGEAMAVPITVRQLEAVIRISEALAKMELSPVATERHVEEAIRLFKVSTIEAASSGVTDNIHVRPEMRAELQQVEGQIKRKVAINSKMSERQLIDALVNVGCNPTSVRRAILVMVQRGEMEYRQERKMVYRKA